jgi:hypothetical protein
MIGQMLIQRRPVEPFDMVVEFEHRLYEAIDD